MPKLKHDWKDLRTLLNSDEANKFVESLGVAQFNTKDRAQFTRKVYRCCSARKFGCKYLVQVVQPHDSTEFQISESGTHAHTETPQMQARKLVETQAKKKKSAQAIRDVLESHDLPIPEDRALYNMIRHDRVKQFGSNLSMGQLIKHCDDHSIDSATDIHTPYVATYQINNATDVFVMFTTKYLLSVAPQSDLIQVDATYKCIWNGFPLKVFGTTDKNRRFHPFGLVITTNETEESYELLFRSFKVALSQVGITEYTPGFVMADGATAITNAAATVFPGAKRLMCFYHAKKNMRDNRNRLPRPEDWDVVEQDIDDLHDCPCDQMFPVVAELVLEKWRHNGWNEYVDYFSEQWIKKLPNWYRGAAPSHPSTNNGIESLNRLIKDYYTLRKALPLGQFLPCADEMVTKWSKNSTKNGFKLVLHLWVMVVLLTYTPEIHETSPQAPYR